MTFRSRNSRRSNILAPVTLAALLSGNVLAADPAAVRFYEDAVARFNAGDASGAMIQLRNSLQRDPGQLPAKVLLGKIYLELGNPVAAEEALVQAEQLGADPLTIALPLAQARNQLGKHVINLDSIRPAGQPPEIAAALWVELGTARLASDDQVGAEIAFQQALDIDPDQAPAKLGLARIRLLKEDLSAARSLAEQARGADPTNPDALLMVGALLEADDDLEGALAMFRQAQAIDRDHFASAEAEAITLLKLGRNGEAAAQFERIVSKRPWNLRARYLLGRALQGAGQKEAAERALRAAAELVSKVTPGDLDRDPDQLLLAALVAMDTEQAQSAFGFLDHYLKLRPQDNAARVRLADLYSRMGKPLEAIRELTRVANQLPDDPQLQVLLGDANTELGDHVTASRHYERALSLATASTRLISRLGLAQHRQGRTDLAIQTMSQLVAGAPEVTTGPSILLANLYYEEGDLVRATEVVDALLRARPQDALGLNMKAAIAIRQGRHDEARKLLESLRRDMPDFGPARINLVKLDILEGRHQDARRALAAMLEADPLDVAAAMTYAELARAVGDPRAAIKPLEQIRTARPDEVEAIIRLADLYTAVGQAPDAIDVVRALDRSVPNDFVVKLKLADLYLRQQLVDEARSVLLTAASLAGSNLPQRLAVTELQVRAGALDDAAQGMQRAMNERPEAIEPRLWMARIHGLRKDYGAAEALLEKLVREHPDHLGALAMLGDVKLASGQFDNAAAIYRGGLERSDRAAMVIGLHRALALSGRRAEALNELETWHERNPENRRVMRVLADHYAGDGDSARALQLYERLVEMNPDDAEVHNNIANLLQPLDSERALQSAMRAHELAPTNAAILDTLGWMLVQLGDLDNGLARLREAVARDGRAPEIRYHLAVALQEYGSRTAALDEFRRALQLGLRSPKRESALERIGRLEGQL